MPGRHKEKDHRGQRNQPCKFFARDGSCRYGSKCKFSHDSARRNESNMVSHIRQTAPEKSKIDEDGETRAYSDWKYLLKKRPATFRSSAPFRLGEFWTGAVKILDGNSHQYHQQLANHLVDDNFAGIDNIHHTLKIRLDVEAHEIDHVKSFLRTITHPSILDSLSLNTAVGTLYNIISGAGGELAIPFLISVCHGVLKTGSNVSDHWDITGSGFGFASLFEALNQLIRRVQRVAFHDDIDRLFGLLENILCFLRTMGISDQAISPQKRSIDALRKIVKLSTGRLEAPNGSASTQQHPAAPSLTTTPSQYPIELPLPGNAHDNDHADIGKISIIPTAAELLSNEAEFLPSSDFRQPHFLNDRVQRYLDTHFRLLRHDAFGPLKAALDLAISSLDAGTSSSKWHRQDSNAHLYQRAHIAHISVDNRRGLEMHISFDLPPQARKKTKNQRQTWWENSKRLEAGSLVCLINSGSDDVKNPLLFIIVEKVAAKTDQSQQEPENSFRQNVVVKMASLREVDLMMAVQSYLHSTEGVLVGIPGLIPATFTPILENLQRVFRLAELPFQEWIVPQTVSGTKDQAPRNANPLPPAYARGDTFKYDLSSILRESGNNKHLSATSLPDDKLVLDRLETDTSLDRGQCRALVHALTREFALIQGPPGTGKSYLGVKLLQVLLASKKSANLGPIVIICYTNHALDQFLCHLLEVGISKIVRIGGQSRSPQLENHNLRVVRQRMQRTRHEGFILGSTYSKIEENFKIAGRRLATIHKTRNGSAWEIYKDILRRLHRDIYSQIYRDEEEGFTVVGRDPLEVWAYPDGPKKKGKKTKAPGAVNHRDIAEIVAKASRNVFSLSLEERQAFCDNLGKDEQDQEIEKLLLDVEEAGALQCTVDDVHKELDRRVLQTSDVIGITTTGLAKNATMLRNLRSKVVICEEAGEVLEAHMISAMMPNVQHIIQIGDHQQLRPQINNYSLSLESNEGQAYQLDRSQFERLAQGQPGLPRISVAQLNIQRRMRPAIADLIRPIYPDLMSHGSVSDHPDVLGMRNNIFWLDHGHYEDGHKEGQVKSHSNEWEVGMTKALVRHLIRQGVYGGTNIAVLTPYSGQLQKLRASLSSDFDISIGDRDSDMLATDGFESPEDNDSEPKTQHQFQKKRLTECVRLATVDNFQGEEAKIIIVSLVRSNKEGKVGFLRTINRINVLLSRAQHGMYLIGSADTYSKTPMWAEVQEKLQDSNGLGDTFSLCCPRHKDTPIRCAEPEDFIRCSPEGGCSLPCEWRLDCGHPCLAKCHSSAMHSAFLCPQQCTRRRSTCDHPCPKTCGEQCGPCLVPMNNVQLSCGHRKDNVPCWQTRELDRIKCMVLVDKTVSACGHTVNVACTTNVDSDFFSCSHPCDHVLECGHTCPGSCSECKTIDGNGAATKIHKTCKQRCQRPQGTCNHICQFPCHADEPCPPCTKQCEISCSHSRCSLACSEPCAPCIDNCAWTCKHQGGCSMPCAAPCDRLPCDERCTEMLKCGHQCPGLCGELCQAHPCHTCGSKGDARVDLLEFKSYSEIDVTETPIVALSCGHFFTAESLDGLVGLGHVYSMNTQGKYTGLLEPSEVVSVPRCPDCKKPIQQHATRRYNRVVNRAVMDETSKRFLVKGLTELKALETLIDKADSDYRPSSKSDQKLSTEEKLTINKQKLKCLRRLQQKVNIFCNAVTVEQQPARKLFDAIVSARVQRHIETLMQDLSVQEAQRPMPEYRALLGGKIARLRVREITMQHEISSLSDASEEEKTVLIAKVQKLAEAFLFDCEAVIEDCNDQNLPNYSVSGSLLYAKAAKSMQAVLSYITVDDFRDTVKASVERAKTLLEQGLKACEAPFEGSQELKNDLEQALKLFDREWYEAVSQEEIESIKSAMVNGPRGFATHSGHWYRCANGHVFAIGECGMPMELAQCPSCGSPIGGQNHQMVEGMERATEME